MRNFLIFSFVVVFFGNYGKVLSASLMTNQIRQTVLDEHNQLRRTLTVPVANNMIKLRYDLILEQVAQNYLDRMWPDDGTGGCPFVHNKNKTVEYIALGGRVVDHVGENWYGGPPIDSMFPVHGGAAHDWTIGNCTISNGVSCVSFTCSEYDNFYQNKVYGTEICNQTNGVTGHFTNLMWAETAYVGCAYSIRCGTLCDYARGGNINLPPKGQITPSIIWGVGGAAASNCPISYRTIENGLCVFDDSTYSPTISPTEVPTFAPSRKPTIMPTSKPTKPTMSPTFKPSIKPTKVPTMKPSFKPTLAPTSVPTLAPVPATTTPQVVFSSTFQFSSLTSTTTLNTVDNITILTAVAKSMNVSIADIMILDAIVSTPTAKVIIEAALALGNYPQFSTTSALYTSATSKATTSITSGTCTTNMRSAASSQGSSTLASSTCSSVSNTAPNYITAITPASDTTTINTKSSSTSNGTIIGAVIGCIIGLLILVMIAIYSYIKWIKVTPNNVNTNPIYEDATIVNSQYQDNASLKSNDMSSKG